MTSTRASVLDTTTLSEVMKARDPSVARRATAYLERYGQFQFSIITRYEILSGLLARGADRQIGRFNLRCLASRVLSLDEAVIDRAAGIYAGLYRSGLLISDADILIAATAMHHQLPLVTENAKHFRRIEGLHVSSWRAV